MAAARRNPAAPRNALARVRKLCLSLPEAHEVEAWGAPTFRVRNKLFAMFASAGNHHGAGRPAVWCKSPAGNQELMVAMDPGRYFVPPYVGPSGWVGVWLDGAADWEELAQIVADAWRLAAPRRLVAHGATAPQGGSATGAGAGAAKLNRAVKPPLKRPRTSARRGRK
jgi:hypothetical protein